MAASTEFDVTGDRKRIYRYVDRNGPVAPATVAETLGVDPESFQHHVAMLARDDLIEEADDGALVVAVHPGEAVEHAEAGVTYTVRPARPADLSGLVGVIRRVATDASYVEASHVAEQLEYEDTVVRQTPTRCRVVFVATVADEVVGWAHVVASERPTLTGTAELTLGVIDEYRRHGVGSHLLRRGVEWAAARDCRKVYNSIPATCDAAIEFLEANDWTVEAVRADHYEIGGDLVDEVMLARRLDG